MATIVLSQRALNRALLDRQLLLERAALPLDEAVDRVGGLQTQYAPSGYVGLWTRLAGFRRDDLTRALEDRTVVQATLMRSTIHTSSRGASSGSSPRERGSGPGRCSPVSRARRR